MADVKLAYGTAVDATITLASLPTHAGRLVGRESTAIDNTTNLHLDYLASGRITTGTTPTVGTTIEVWAVAAFDGTTFPHVFAGTDTVKTITLANIKNNICFLVTSITVTATSNTEYFFSGVSLASVFRGVIPPKFSLFVTQNTGPALNATAGNHQMRIQPVFETVT